MFKKIIKFIFWFYCIFVSIASAEIYKWTDAQGNVHYGDKINSNSTDKSNPMDVDVSTQGNLKVNRVRADKRKKLIDAFDDDRTRENKKRAKEKKKNKKYARSCIRYKDKMRRYNRARSLYKLDEEGKRITMSNEERERSTNILRKRIKKYCK